MTAVAFVAVGCIAFYAWFAYPALLRVLSRRRVRTARLGTAGASPNGAPRVAVLLSAHDEEDHVGARIENLIGLDYPGDKIAIYIGVDGGSDRTAEIAQQKVSGLSNAHVLAHDENRGKVAVLKELVVAAMDQCDPDLLIFTDANTHFEQNVVRRLVSHFSDPGVGGVCGRLVLLDGSGAETDEGVYWRWETTLKTMESAIDSCLGANGAIYAIRAGLFWREIPDETIIDDFVIGMKVRERGFRMVYDPEAVAGEDLPVTVEDEWHRRVRIGAGGYQAMRLCSGCLLPRHGLFAWMFWSHKVLRWFTPHLLIALVGLAAWVLWDACRGALRPGWMVAGASALICALAAALGCAGGRLLRRSRHALAKPLRCCEYFFTIQAALFVGFLRYCRGDLSGRWRRTARRP